jgi:hypothetical protein
MHKCSEVPLERSLTFGTDLEGPLTGWLFVLCPAPEAGQPISSNCFSSPC